MTRRPHCLRWAIPLELLIACCLIAGSLQGGDWPQIRGPNSDGIAVDETLADSWPADGPPLLWTVRLGQGFSGFAIAGGRAITQYQTPLGQYVLCLDVRDGGVLWEHKYGEAYDPVGIYPGPRSTPAIADDVVVFHAPNGLLGCLDLQQGREIWQVDLKKVYGLSGTGFGCAASPLVRDGRIYLPVGGKNAAVVALSLKDGSRLWSHGDDPASYCTPTPFELDGVELVANFLQNCLVVHERRTGREVWRLDLSAGYDEHAASPLFADSLLVVSSPFRAGASAYRLQTERAEGGDPKLSGKIAWQSPSLSNDTASSVAFEGAIYGFDLKDVQAKAHRPSRGEFRCLNANDGKVRWSSSDPGHATVIVADGKLILFNDKGELILARADRDQYLELGRRTVFEDEVCWTAPALADGRVIVRSHGRATCFWLGVGDPVNPPRDAIATLPTRPLWRRWHWAWLLGGEREHPFMRAEPSELVRWYLFCLLGCWSPACVLSMCVTHRQHARNTVDRGLEAIGCDASSHALHEWAFASLGWTLIVLGIVVTPLANRFTNDFVLTWPAAIYGAFQTSLAYSLELWHRPSDRALKRRARLTGAALIAICAAYFLLLRDQSLPHEWVFLICGVFSVPTTLAAMAIVRRNSWSGTLPLASLVAFSAYYWLAPVLPLVRDWIMP